MAFVFPVEEINIPNDSDHEHEPKRYPPEVVDDIRCIYVGAAIIWIILLVVLKVPKPDLLLLIFLTIPLILYLIGYHNAQYLETSCDGNILRTNVITIMIVSAAIISQWTPAGKKVINKTGFYKLLTASFVLLLLSVTDVWIIQKDMPTVRHVKVAIQTASIVLLIVAVYSLYKKIAATDSLG